MEQQLEMSKQDVVRVREQYESASLSNMEMQNTMEQLKGRLLETESAHAHLIQEMQRYEQEMRSSYETLQVYRVICWNIGLMLYV